MERKWFWRAFFFLFITAFSVVYLLPTFVSEKKLPDIVKKMFNKKVLQGLDLAGGVHLEYAIDTDIIIENQLDNFAEDIKVRLMEAYGEKNKAKSEHFDITVKGTRIEIQFKNAIDKAKLNKAVDSYTDRRDPRLVKTGEEKNSVFFVMDGKYAKDLETKALARAVDTIRDRVDQYGVASPEIYRKDDMIVVELPGLDKSSQERVKANITRSAHLEFKIVDSQTRYMHDVVKYLKTKYGFGKFNTIKQGPYKGFRIERDDFKARKGGKDHKAIYIIADIPTRNLPVDQQKEFIKARDILEKQLFGKELPAAGIAIPKNREIGFERDYKTTQMGTRTAQRILRAMVLYKTTKVSGEYIINAQIGYNQENQAVVNATFNRTGGKYFSEMTGAHTGWKMAIKLDKWVESAPVIQDKIFENVQITVGGFGGGDERLKQVNDLINVLRSGSLPAPLTMEMELNVGPSLGKESIKAGIYAMGLGALFVIFFMIFYYRWSGVIAISALIVNVILMLAIMAGLEARLTLPGMAGIVLTLGMAVDANVIIYERIREELLAGKNVRAAIDAGYSRAFWAIMDGQLTTMIAGVVLYEFGTGPIKGFAVTLIIGIITSILTGVFFTRVIYDFITSRRKMESLSI
ncbi:protein translocase subunit SecD [Myxococcota bacterium]|nr:protein translocase subunit SecD [Myxococcota bacterium]MBU1380062.1 protein translocase subunit SecD [Myxococcota bacterium]MBU1495520.1 protein translocase subunit SecD [Myxococcota bacterium]